MRKVPLHVLRERRASPSENIVLHSVELFSAPREGDSRLIPLVGLWRLFLAEQLWLAWPLKSLLVEYLNDLNPLFRHGQRREVVAFREQDPVDVVQLQAIGELDLLVLLEADSELDHSVEVRLLRCGAEARETLLARVVLCFFVHQV